MEITITANFDDPQSASMAASALGMVQGGGLGMTVTAASMPATGAPIASLGRPVAAPGFGGHTVTVRCKADLESYAVGELAALGARKISVAGQSQS